MPKKSVKKKTTKRKKSVKKKALELIPKVIQSKTVLTDIEVLEDIFEGDKNLTLFYLCWLKNGRNSTKAYQELHPNVNDKVAAVVGCRLLRKVKVLGGIEVMLESYGIGFDKYLKQLDEGLQATIRSEVITGVDDDGTPIYSPINDPDHKTRRHYHKALGQMLGIEGPDVQINNQNNNLNNNQNTIDNISDDELDDLVDV